MNQDVVSYLNQLEGFKTACKNMHFSADSMSEHKFFDELADLLADKQDEFGEIEQGIHGQFDKTTIKGVDYKSESSKKFIQDLVSATKEFYKKIEGDEYIGMRSSVEDFLASLDKQPYLLDLCLKEDFKRSYKTKLNERVVDRFTPYPEGEGKKMFDAANQRSAEERNPAYAAALKAAAERKAAKAQKNESLDIDEAELHGIVQEAMGRVMGKFLKENKKVHKPTLEETVQRVIDNFVANL